MSVEDLLIHFQYGHEEDEYGEDYRFTRQFYMPGEEMRGVVSVHLRTPLRVRGITIHFLGTATVSWEATHKHKVYQASEIHLESAKPLLDIGYNDAISLPAGLHQFGFRYLLPTELPSTFNGVYGQVTYLAKVKLDAEDERNTTLTSEPFMVLHRPRLPTNLYFEKSLKKSKQFIGFNTGKVSVSCKIDKQAAVPGDTISVDGEIVNFTGKEITLIQAAMIVEGHYFAQGHEIVFRQYLSKRDDVYDVEFRRGRRWRHVFLPVPPYLADSGLEHCNIMNIKYFFQFKVCIEGKDDIVLETPLYVGAHAPDYGPEDENFLLRRMYQNIGAIDNEQLNRHESDFRDLPYNRGELMSPEINPRSLRPQDFHGEPEINPRSLRPQDFHGEYLDAIPNYQSRRAIQYYH